MACKTCSLASRRRSRTYIRPLGIDAISFEVALEEGAIQMRTRWPLAAIAAVLLASVSARAQTTFLVNMNGTNEPNASGQLGAGDPDGFATGTVTLNPITDTVSWNLTYGNISGDAISGFHIHGPGATLTTNRPVFIPLEPLSSTTVPNGTQIGTRTSALTADIGTRIDQILANPSEFYVNLHS